MRHRSGIVFASASIPAAVIMRKTRGKSRRSATPVTSDTPAVSPAHGRRRRAVILAAFALTFTALEVNSYTRKSATWDEPMHLTSGYAALAYGDYRVDPSHPPFLRMWAALPLLVDRPALDVTAIDNAVLPGWLEEAYQFAHQFLYVANDADRLLYAARFMVVLLGVLLGVLVFCWMYEWLGLAPALAALVLYTLEPNLAAHSALATTDLAVTCFLFGAVYFLWRTCEHPTRWNIAGLSAFASLAIVTKFSAVVLVPIILVLLTAAAMRRRHITPRLASLIASIVIVSMFVAIWAAYGFRYDPSASGSWSFRLDVTDPGLAEPAVARLMLFVDRLHVLPNAFTQGLIYNYGSVQQLGMFLAGQYSTDGWWYYFPFAFLIKTPIALLVLLGIGAAILAWDARRTASRTLPFIAVPVAMYMAVAIASGINIGLRHILPVYPFVLLVAAAGVSTLWASNRGRLAATTLTVLCLTEFATAYPYTLTFFNRFAGGPQNGYRYLSDSNLGWGQNLKGLKRWMDRNGVSQINLAYSGQADPEYYGIEATYLPGSPSFKLKFVSRPKLPGFVAIGSTVLSGVYLQPHWRLFYRPFQDLAPVAVVGNSIRVYWLERWPEATGRLGDVPDVTVHRTLADTLLFGQQWPTRALRHYREYLSRRPNDVDAIVNAAIALSGAGDTREAMSMLRHAVETDPENGAARLALAKGSFGGGDLRAAELHVERAVALRPGDAEAHDLLGRVRAVQGRIDEAIQHFRVAISLDSSFEPARDHLARASAMKGR